MTSDTKAGERIREIREKYKAKEIDFEHAMFWLADIGVCPNLLNDDNGKWAVEFEGFQSVATGTKASDIETHFFVEKSKWKKTPREALLHALKENKKYQP